ncbi:MAG TPA: succinate--CoA ligase subunit alpha, partial [Thermoplasmata archaeon]|nr:succinate--CoA ligase subunit alpha [Thermoplasmata archaeon]
MAVLLDEKTKLIVQGITGHQGQFNTRAMLDYGTKVVAGVTPGKAGERVHDVPVFDSCFEGVDETGANASIMFVPAPFA